MVKDLVLLLRPEEAAHNELIKLHIAGDLGVETNRITGFTVHQRSIDARRNKVKINLRLTAYVDEPYKEEKTIEANYKNVQHAEHQVVIVGAGPAGLFAALKALELGIKPIVIERGKNVKDRRRDLAQITRNHIVNPESNYCFGEGGAGTYSDGKLYTRSKKRGDVNRILNLLVQHGAEPSICIDTHPHIGTNKLPGIIQTIRETILQHGGEVLFSTKLTNFKVTNGALKAVEINHEEWLQADAFILATGHSARDIFYLLHQNQIKIEAKPYALGVRAEHPQTIIDSIQYHCDIRSEYLPPASYKLVQQVQGLGVYSFCMCPGGIIAPCATAQNEVVTNGWSPSKRNNPFANSGIVVSVNPEELPEFRVDPTFAGLELQKSVEQTAWSIAGKTQTAPAQRMVDFATNKVSTTLPDCSYLPGITSVDLKEVLPAFVAKRLQQAFIEFGKKMKGYYTNEAVLVAPESRTSSPIRVPRNPQTLEHVEVENLFPCGEGAGYAGGIISAAIDGEKCIQAAAIKLGIHG